MHQKKLGTVFLSLVEHCVYITLPDEDWSSKHLQAPWQIQIVM